MPDAEIADALRNCLDACGDIAEVASLPADDVMRFSDEYARGRSRTQQRIPHRVTQGR